MNGKTINDFEIPGFDFVNGVEVILKKPGEPFYLHYKFNKPFEARMVSLIAGDTRKLNNQFRDIIILKSSDSGPNGRKIVL